MSTTRDLRIYLFSSFRLIRNGTEVSSREWYTRQARQLFKVLFAERGRLVPATRLVDLLWPESVEHAHKALRSAVSALRDVLEPDREPWLSSNFIPRGQEGYALTFPGTCHVWVDTVEFERLLDSGLDGISTSNTHAFLEDALQLYTGDYLAEDSDATWAFAERARLRERYFAGVVHLMQWQKEKGFYNEAITLGHQALNKDVCREVVYRLIMQCQALAGHHSAALQTFEQCDQMLTRHLKISVSPQTLALRTAILKGEFPGLVRSRYHNRQQEKSVMQASSRTGGRGSVPGSDQRLAEMQEQALHSTLQAADFARRTFHYQQALANYNAALHLLRGASSQNETIEQHIEWWERLYHGRSLVCETLQDWQGIRESLQYLSRQAKGQQGQLLTYDDVSQITEKRSLIEYLSSPTGSANDYLQIGHESGSISARGASESLYILLDTSHRWSQLLMLDDEGDSEALSEGIFPTFSFAPASPVSDWDQIVDILGPSRSAFTLTHYGWLLLLQGPGKEAEHCLQAALKAAKTSGQVTWEIFASLHLSRFYGFHEQYELCNQTFEYCLDLCDKAPDVIWAKAWPRLNQAYYLIYTGHPENAEDIFLELQEQLAPQNLQAYLSSIQAGLGLIALARREYSQANTLLHEALAQRQSIYVESYVLAEVGLAELDQQQGAYDVAYERLCRVLRFSGRRSLLQHYVSSAFALVRLSLQMQRTKGIAEFLKRVSQIAGAAGSPRLIYECRTLLEALSA